MERIDFAARDDWPALSALLTECRLPVEGLEEHLPTTLVARAGGRLVASAALELYGAEALLRSVAVAGPYRGRGLGRRMVEGALDLARARGVVEVYLLTLTAAAFFERLGFDRVGRDAVPARVQQSLEFRALCPATAVAMRCRLARALETARP